MNKHSRLYRSLRWSYQPIKSLKKLLHNLITLPRRKAKLLECKNSTGFSGLHIGCGPYYMPDWVNTDITITSNADFFCDITQKLPIPDKIFDVIYGAEVIEHIELEEARLFFREAYRILKPGGVMRLTTPDTTEVCKIFLGLRDDVKIEDFGTAEIFGPIWIEDKVSKELWINYQFRSWGHKHLWTFESLVSELTKAGFCEVQRCEPQKTKSDKSQLNCLENRYGDNPPSWIFTSSLILEARKSDKLNSATVESNVQASGISPHNLVER